MELISRLVLHGGSVFAQAEVPRRPPLLDSSRLEPNEWNQVLVGLTIVSLAGIILVLIVMAWGRYARRVARTGRGPSRMARDAWYEKPLASKADRPAASDDD